MNPGTQAGYTVTRAVQTLELLARGSLTARELAEDIHVHTRTARRILQRLEIDGYARKPMPRAAFESTPALRDLGRRLSADGAQATRTTRA